MPENVLTGKSAAKEVKAKLGLLNALNTFVVFVLLAVILSYLYEPVGRAMSFLPELSVAVIILIATVLTLLSVTLSRIFAVQVVRSIERYSNLLKNVLNVTSEIKDEIYGDILLEKIMEHSIELTGSEAGSILLDEGGALVFKTVKGSQAGELVGKKVPLDKGVGGWVLQHSEPVMISDVSQDKRFDSHMDELTGFSTRSILSVPLRTKDRTIGVIELLNKSDGNYLDRDLELVSYLADQAAISIERAKFYEDQRNFEIQFTDILLDTLDRLMPDKRGHSKRVASYCSVVARSLRMSDERARKLYYASLLHDLGFIRIAQNRFADADMFRQHPTIGYEMLAAVNFYSDIAPFVLCHHERYDGGGYPSGLQGAKIPLEARIIAVAEAFDSMTSNHSYKQALGFEVAIEELKKHAGTQFDPAVVEHFAANISEAEVRGRYALE